MDSSLSHLPDRKRGELMKLARMIREVIPRDIEMIVLYGSYARGDWKEEADLPPPEARRSGHASDYDILIVTATPEAARSIELRTLLDRKARSLGLSAQPRFIAYDIAALNERLADGRYFYLDIKKEGKLLYDSGRVKLAEARELPPAERLRIAREYYEHWSDRARSFWRQHEHAIKDGDLKMAAFDLHQVAEASFKTILLVFTGYSPDEHWLGMLSEMAAEFDPSLREVLPGGRPQATDEQERLFKLLDYAYIGARYDAKYRIAAEELEYLAGCVRKLLERVEGLCGQALGRLER